MDCSNHKTDELAYCPTCLAEYWKQRAVDLEQRLAAVEAERELYKRAFEFATEGGLLVNKEGWGGRKKTYRLSTDEARRLFLDRAIDAARGGE